MRRHVAITATLMGAALHAAACAPARSTQPELPRRESRIPVAGAAARAVTPQDVAEAEPNAPAVPPADSAITCGSDARRVNCVHGVTVPGDDAGALLRPVSSVTLTHEELKGIGDSFGEWIAFAQRSAGTSVGDVRIYVDGMPAHGNLPSAAIARISVNVDPFSAEYGGVNQLRIDIDSRPPDRRWRFESGLPSLTGGGGSPLASARRPAARSLSGGLSGPVVGTPLTFSVHASQRVDRQSPLFADAASGRVARGDDDLRVSTHSNRLTAGVVLSTARVLARLTGSSARVRSENAGVGGLNAVSTAQTLATADDYAQAAWRVAGATLVHRGGASVTQSRLDGNAPSSGPAVLVTGQATRGSNELTASRHTYFAWDVKHVVTGPAGRKPWKAGIETAHTAVGDRREWNPYGRLQLASPAASTGTWTIVHGSSAVAADATSAALFGEQTIWHGGGGGAVRAGGRIDWQNGDGVLVSPRLAGAARVAGFQLSGGAGMFVQPWVPDTFATAALRSGDDVLFLVIPDVSLDSIGTIESGTAERLRMELAPSYGRRRDLVVRAGVRRTAGPLQAGIERTWTMGTSLSGARRSRDAQGLVDLVDSDRRLRRAQTHVRTSVTWRGHALVARYEHAASQDDTDGPFVLPAFQDNVEAEWARSAAIARHTATVTATVRLPGTARLSLTYDARTGTPYNVITGADGEGLGTFTDRGGRPRNAGLLPATRNAAIYASRTVRVQRLRDLAIDLGVRMDNVTDRTNVTAVGRVAGSALFGRPLNALPGRAIRFWASLGR